MEKAVAKLLGDYGIVATIDDPEFYLRTLTGLPSTKVDITSLTDATTELYDLMADGTYGGPSILKTASSSDTVCGLSPDQYMSVLGLFTLGSPATKMILLKVVKIGGNGYTGIGGDTSFKKDDITWSSYINDIPYD